MNSKPPNAELVRVALPEHRGTQDPSTGAWFFLVPGDFYPDRCTRGFTIPPGQLVTVDEPAGLMYRQAIYCRREYAAEKWIPEISNPRLPRRGHR